MKKFFRLAIVFAIAGAALLTGCTKDYGTDIADLQSAVSKIQDDVKALQDAVKDGVAIKDVRSDDNGGVIIELANGKTFHVEKGAKGDNGTNGTNGNNGKDADVWTIGDDGFWYKNDVKTDYKAIGDMSHAGHHKSGIHDTYNRFYPRDLYFTAYNRFAQIMFLSRLFNCFLIRMII